MFMCANNLKNVKMLRRGGGGFVVCDAFGYDPDVGEEEGHRREPNVQEAVCALEFETISKVQPQRLFFVIVLF